MSLNEFHELMSRCTSPLPAKLPVLGFSNQENLLSMLILASSVIPTSLPSSSTLLLSILGLGGLSLGQKLIWGRHRVPPPQADDLCTICHEDISPPCEILPCYHIFHRQCLRQW